MILLKSEIISNSEMIRNYKACREKAESFDKIFVLKNNQPDAVLFSITEYEKISAFLEYIETLDEEEIGKAIELLPKKGNRKNYTIGLLRRDINQIVAVDIIE